MEKINVVLIVVFEEIGVISFVKGDVFECKLMEECLMEILRDYV